MDFGLFCFLVMMAFAGVMIVINTFKWGHDKEKNGERTDIFGNENNHMPEDEIYIYETNTTNPRYFIYNWFIDICLYCQKYG